MLNSVQRLVTRSRFDHVGVLVRDYAGTLFILEATQSNGVNTFNWTNYVEQKQYKEIERIVYRHMKYDRSGEATHKLGEFLKVSI